jgi:predicted transcriptional regulator
MTAPRRGAAALSRSDQLRLRRLANEAGTTPARILKTVLRDGFEYTEWFVRQVNEGEADLKAGQVMSTAEVLALIERQRAARGRRSAAA